MTDWLELIDVPMDAVINGFEVLLGGYPELCDTLRSEGKLGGYACVAQQDGLPILIMALGEPNEAKSATRLEFCQEKVRRLAANTAHSLSFESRDPDNNKWGGAARGKRYIVSFSGMPERLDEYFALAVLYHLQDLSEQEILRLLLAHDNPYRSELHLENFG
ncbi:MAG: hypothetical protein JWL75_43 [Parcubacteria group bacterium]|nr:hypothetical protein [Parcubacteria group bacterium]